MRTRRMRSWLGAYGRDVHAPANTRLRRQIAERKERQAEAGTNYRTQRAEAAQRWRDGQAAARNPAEVNTAPIVDDDAPQGTRGWQRRLEALAAKNGAETNGAAQTP